MKLTIKTNNESKLNLFLSELGYKAFVTVLVNIFMYIYKWTKTTTYNNSINFYIFHVVIYNEQIPLDIPLVRNYLSHAKQESQTST